MSDDDLHYVNLDDESWQGDADELEPIDLDALDDAIEPEDEPDAETEEILEAITTLDDEIKPADAVKVEPPAEPVESPAPEAEIPAVEEKAVEVPTPLDLDKLDDAIEPEAKQDEETEEILEAITTLDDEIEPADAVKAEPPAEPEPEKPVAEVKEPEAPPVEVKEPEKPRRSRKAKLTPKEVILPPVEVKAEEVPVVEETPKAAEPPAAEEAAPQPDWVYRVLLSIPTEMGQEMSSLREQAEIKEMPQPGFELIPPFRTDNPTAMQAALQSWARNHLPLQLEVTSVIAEVIGARDYIAAWSLLPGDDLDEAQADLIRALTVPNPPEKPPLRVTIGEKIAPGPFPRLIARMQRDFEPYVWHAETASLVRQDAESDSAQWETLESYR